MTFEHFEAYYGSPLGPMRIAGSEAGISAIEFCSGQPPAQTGPHPSLHHCLQQLDEYFQGRRRNFSFELDLSGTEFQEKVWRQVLKIPFGATASYAEIARRIGHEKAFRAVGRANGQNRLAIVVPCHRLIGSDGQLTGYGGGLWRKAWLLEHERRLAGAL